VTSPTDRSAQLIQSREELARAIDRFQKLSDAAKETLTTIRRENADLHKRLEELTTLVEHERTISKQNEMISQSASSEVLQLKSEIESLKAASSTIKAKRDEQDAFMHDQLEVITKLKVDLESHAKLLLEQESQAAATKKEIDHLKHELTVAESRLQTVTEERDKIKSLYVEQEREDAQWALKLTEADAQEAQKAIDRILEQFTRMTDHA
jgi:chromosome segregation ATPase